MWQQKILGVLTSGLLLTTLSPALGNSVEPAHPTSPPVTTMPLLDEGLRPAETITNLVPAESESETVSSSSEEMDIPKTTEIELVEEEVPTTTETTPNEHTPQPRDVTLFADQSTAEVSDWASFVKAVRDETITKIMLLNSFDNPSNTDTSLSNYSRTNDLEIDGQGYRVDFKSTSIRLGSPTGNGAFHMHDITLNQRYGGANSEDIVGARLNTANGAKWRYRFGNLTAESGVQRLARATHGEVTVYGQMDVNTRAENFYLGSLKMEDNTYYRGNVNYYNYSIFWYNTAANAGSTGESKEFTIGKNCHVNLTQSQTSGTTYPAVYAYYQAFTVGENSILNVNMPGNAVRFDMDGSGLTIKSGAIVNLTSKQNSGSVVAFSNNNTYLTVEPEAYFYTIGSSNQPLINLAANGSGTGTTRRQNNRLILNQPAQYDIRNLRDSYTAVQVGGSNYADNEFRIIQSDIDLWKLSTAPLGPSDETYAMVDEFVVKGSGNSQAVTSTNEALLNFSQSKYRRISGMNQLPTVEWSPVTDADKTIVARVVIGYVPDNNGLNEAGEVAYIPVYASKNQAQVTITDTHNQVHADLLSDEEGYVSYVSEYFNFAGQQMSALAQRGPWCATETSEVTVIDVTPPAPAEILGGQTQPPTITKLSGQGEPNARVTLTLNDVLVPNVTTVVAADGTWQLSLADVSLQKEDVLQIFLQDTSGAVTQLDEPPLTNDAVGNRQPATDYPYREALFLAATKVTIAGSLELVSVPEVFDFGVQKISNCTQDYTPTVNGKLVISDTRGSHKGSWRLTLNESTPLQTTTSDLSGLLFYTNEVTTYALSNQKVVIEERKLTADGQVVISDEWQTTQGLHLKVPVERQGRGTYQGTLTWTLEDVPAN